MYKLPISALLVSLLLGGVAIAKPPKAAIRHVSLTEDAKGTVLRVNLDVLDESLVPVPAKSLSITSVVSSGAPVALQDSSLGTVATTGAPTSVLAIVPTSSIFVSKGTEGANGTPEPSPFELFAEGMGALLQQLGPKDAVAIYSYGTAGSKVLAPWAPKQSMVPTVAELPTPKVSGPPSKLPSLYARIKEAAELLGKDPTLPARKVLIVVSDGLSNALSSPKTLEKRIEKAAAAIESNDVELIVVGYSLLTQEPLGSLAKLCTMTGGIYLDGDGLEAPEDLPKVLTSIGPLVTEQIVFEAQLAPGEAIDTGALSLELDVETAGKKHHLTVGKPQ